jgi:hypothetical protein
MPGIKSHVYVIQRKKHFEGKTSASEKYPAGLRLFIALRILHRKQAHVFHILQYRQYTIPFVRKRPFIYFHVIPYFTTIDYF